MQFEYQVFLSHNSADKPEVKLLANRLRRQTGLRPFLDEWNLVPGESSQAKLVCAIESSETAAIFYGPHKVGPWHDEEIQVLLDKAARSRDDFRAIPVLLPGASEKDLSLFLKQRTWVDFRSGLDNDSAFQRLIAGIKGNAVEPNGYELPDDPAPYRGLERFEAEQKDYFFGREADIRRLKERLATGRFVAIVGASGCGKSSLVRAGLHTELASEVLPEVHDWRIVTFLPGSDPFRALAEQLAGAVPAPDRIGVVDDLAKRFEDRGDGLRTAIGALFADDPKTALIVVDQFEEILTHLTSSPDSAGRSSARVERLIANLVDAAENSNGRIRVLITLRADFIPQCLEYPQLRSLFERNQLLLGELGPEAVREAVKFPARKVGAFFENGLVELILRDVQRQRGSLPLLQHALKELWQARRGPWLTLDAYEKSGGVAGALRRRAQYTYEKKLQDDQQRAIARSIFLRLTTLGEGVSDSRRRTPHAEIFPSGIDRRVVDDVLAVLSHKDARLVVVNADDTIEVTHETLIQTWDTLRGWIDTNRQQLRRHRRLTESANEWEENKEDPSVLYRGVRLDDVKDLQASPEITLNKKELAFLEASVAERKRQEEEKQRKEDEKQRQLQERHQFLVGAAVLFAVLFVAAAGFAIFGFLQKSEAERQKATAEKEAKAALHAEQTAKEQKTLAEQQKVEAERQARLATEAQQTAEKQEVLARAGEDKAKQAASQANVSLARYSKEVGNDTQALAYLAKALKLNPRNFEAGALTAALLTQESWPAVTGAIKHDDQVLSAQFSADGQRVVTASVDHTARVWDAASGKPLSEPMKHDGAVYSAQFSPDGQRVVTASVDKTARVWDAASGKPLSEPIKHDDAVYSAQFSPDGRRVVTASVDKTARVWDAASGKPLTEPMQHHGPVQFAQFSPDGQRVVTASVDKTARVWDAATGKALSEPMKHDGAVYSAQFSPDGQRVVTASVDKTARVWDAASGKPLSEPIKHDDTVYSAQFSPDGRRVVTASWDLTARVWDAASGKALSESMKHDDVVYSAQFSPDGQRVVTASRDHTARLWDAASGKALSEPMKHNDAVDFAQFDPDGQRVATASVDKTALVWDVASGKALSEPMKHDSEVYSAQFSPDGQRVVTASDDHTARLWDAATGKALSEPMKHKSVVYSAQFSRDGQRVVTVSDDHTARIWDAASGKPLSEPMKHDGAVYSAQFSPDGQRVVTASVDKTARVWDAATGKALSEPMKHDGAVYSAQFSPDGQRVVTASWDLTARVWDAASGKPLTEPMQHHGPVQFAQFSPDGQRVATASVDTALVWDVASGKALSEPMKHKSVVYSAQFSPDGQRVVTASDDHTAQVWDAASGKAFSEPMTHDRRVNSAQFSPDGQRVVTASDDHTARVWDAASGKALSEPMTHDRRVNSAQFSPDGQRVVTASDDHTARVWDVPTITSKDRAEDVDLLASLAEASGGLSLQPFGRTEILTRLAPDEAIAMRGKIAAKFQGASSKLTPLQRFLKWSVADRRIRTISPFSEMTIAEWLENCIKEGTLGGLRAAMLVDPSNARVVAHFGMALANLAVAEKTDPDDARRARAEADYQTHRAIMLATDNDEVKKLRMEVVKLLHLPSDPKMTN